MASNSAPTSPSPSDRYFCHRCVREVDNINQDAFTCPFCNQGFLEQISSHEQEEHDDEEQLGAGNAAAAVDFNEFFRNVAMPLLFPGGQRQGQGQGSTPGGQGAQSSSTNTAQPATAAPNQGQPGRPPQQQPQPQLQGMPWFLQNLLEGLAGGGGGAFQFEVQFNDGQPQFFGTLPLHGNPGDYAWGPGGLDAIVTRLLNQFEGGAPPLTEEQIRNLPRAEISQEQVEKRLQCTVCMDDFKLQEKVRRLPCGHHFHDACIVPWLSRHNTCPVCRKAAAEEAHSSNSGPSGGPPGSSGAGNRPQGGTTNQQAWDVIEELD